MFIKKRIFSMILTIVATLLIYGCSTNPTKLDEVSASSPATQQTVNTPQILVTPSTSDLVPPQTIQAENDLIFKSNQLGIEIHFPQAWKGKYVISEDIAAKKVDVKFVTGDILFGVVFLTEDDWIAQQVGGAVRKIAERNGYVLVLWKPTEAPYQLPKDKLKEFVDISNESSISWASWVRITSSFDTKLFQSQTRAQITKLNEKNVLSILASRLELLEEDLEWVGEHPSKAGGWIQSLSHPNERWIVNLQTGDVYLGLSSNNSLRGPYLFNLLDNNSSK